MRVWTYILDHDLGFAPNPFFRHCTLAACKPKIRRYAKLHDYVVGTGSAARRRQGHLVYWMKVDEVITFDKYWADARFRCKRPTLNGSYKQQYGDNIYHRDEISGQFIQEDSFHSEPDAVTSEGNLKRDTGTTDRVLIGREYTYWGGSGPQVPAVFSEFVHSTQGEKCNFPQDRAEAFVQWLRAQAGEGYAGEPTDWPE